MSEIKKRESRLYPTVIFILLCMAVFAVLFLQKSMEPVVPNVNKIRTEINASAFAPQDSVFLVGFTLRLDSLQNEIEIVRDQYQMDINIGIDRLNSWIGFWLAMAGFVLLLGGIWQYMQVKRYDEAWSRMEDKFVVMKAQFEEEKKDLGTLRDRLKLENTIFNLLRTMSAFHDPMMLCKEDDRKSLMLLYIEKAKDLLVRYYKFGKGKEAQYSNDEQLILVLMYSNFRINICRSLDVFTSPSANLAAKRFLDYVEENESNFRYGMSMCGKDVEEFLKKLEELIVGLKRKG